MSRAASFRPAAFESLDSASIVSFGSCLILGAAFMLIVQMTPVRSFESLTLEQLPDRVTRLLLNESDLARLSAPEQAALPPEAVVPSPEGTTAPEAGAPEEAPTVSRVAPPSDARGLPGSEPGDGTGGDGSGGGGGGGGGPVVGARGAAVAAGVAQAVAATGALAEVDRIVGDFTGVVASERGGKALRQGGSGGGVERRAGTPGARARTGAELGGVDEILGRAGSGGGRGNAGTAGAGGGMGGGGGGGGGGVGRAQVRIAAPAPLAADAAAAGATRSPGALMAVVQRHAAAVRFCYNRLLQRKPGASGQIVIRLTVSGEGAVSEASVVRSTLGDSELESCVLNQAREWRFAPAAEPRFSFDVPFVFTPPSGGG